MATLKPRHEVDDDVILDESADLVASGYEAACPSCKEIAELDEVPASADLVYCELCELWFDTAPPEHAYG
ncbi:hypothetical protein LCGC14_1053980 [marine sediment metagenome]|uniref:Transcription factor zinc-finger domain-containing protein n=1 Tax=marine sediment metagenome TaxID=412755 RepID=A0A0F9MSI0_9ZZZZ